MVELSFKEYFRCLRENTFSFDDEELRDELKQKIKEGYSLDALKNYALDHLAIIKEDYIDDTEIIDEETSGWEFNQDVYDYVYTLLDETTSNLGEM